MYVPPLLNSAPCSAILYSHDSFNVNLNHLARITSGTPVSAIKSEPRYNPSPRHRSSKSPAALSMHVNLSPEWHWTDCRTTCRLSPVLEPLPHTNDINPSIHSKVTDPGTSLVLNVLFLSTLCVRLSVRLFNDILWVYVYLFYTQFSRKKKDERGRGGYLTDLWQPAALYFNTKCVGSRIQCAWGLNLCPRKACSPTGHGHWHFVCYGTPNEFTEIEVLFYLKTAASRLPSTRWTYKASKCKGQRVC